MGWLALLALATSCGGDVDHPTLEVSSSITPLTGLTVSVIDAPGALVSDHRIDNGGAELPLPLKVAIDGRGRSGTVRVLLWGRSGPNDVAFGARSLELEMHELFEVRLDVPGPDCDGDRIPDPEDRCVEVADPMQTDLDQDGIGDACVSGAPCLSNLLGNGDFEEGLAEWNADTLSMFTHVDGARSGSFAARLCKTPNGTPTSVDVEVERAAQALAPGREFRLDAYVRSTTQAENLEMRLIENDGEGNPIDSSGLTNISLGPDWNLLSTSHTTVGEASSLDVQLKLPDAPDGACFDFDAVCLVEVFACSVGGERGILQDLGPDGLLVFEAEDATENLPASPHMWSETSSLSGHSGAGAMQAVPNDGTSETTAGTGAEIRFPVVIRQGGTQYVWVRGLAIGDDDDSFHLGVDGSSVVAPWYWNDVSGTWLWQQTEITPLSTGSHTIHIWMREDGFAVDKIVFTNSGSYDPSTVNGGLGPAPSPRSGE